jgi:PAS domain S-box-containing protein
MTDNPNHGLADSVTGSAIYTLDANGLVVSWNRASQRLLGYDAAEIVGQHLSTFYRPQDVEAGEPGAELRAAACNGDFEGYGWRVRKDGMALLVDTVVNALRDPDGDLIGFATLCRDRPGQRAVEDALRESEERFRLLVQTIRDYAILMLDPEGRVTSWNTGAERIKGYRADEILGRSFTTFYPPEAVLSGFPQSELEAATRDGRFEDEGWRVRKDGSRFWANVVITALRDPSGELLGFAKITRDLTARRDIEEQARRLAAEQAAHAEAERRSQELEELNRQLQEQATELEAKNEQMITLTDELQSANDGLQQALAQTEIARRNAERSAADATAAYQELDQFAYVASHDLKAPLRGIANLAQWIRDDLGDGLTDESADHLRMMQGRVRRMEALIDGILTYSRAGRVRSERERIDTGALLSDVIELLAPTAGVKIEVQQAMPVLHAERVPLQQVFMNLIGNAIKHGGAGHPDIRIRVEWRDLGDAVEFAVQDNGPGIAPQYHERVWRIFQTLAARDRVEGTGIGLSLVRKIVEARGGRVALESATGDGATFRFVWPRSFGTETDT